ncbi:MAG TPA: beta-ketoacyl synthase N-terminal-like domain-containing protein [Chitinophaga sp.]|nr:beta-ketoacyl synthase N-terminal-like domain-containing protein [Chitinophaga sp.]
MSVCYVHTTNIVSNLGFTTAENFKAVLEGRSGLDMHAFDFDTQPFCTSVIDETKLDDAFTAAGGEGEYTKLGKMIFLSVESVHHELETDISSPDLLWILCTTKADINALADADTEDEVLYPLVHKIEDHFSLYHKPMIISNACISGLQGLIAAQRLISEGAYRYVIITGADLVSTFTLSGFNAFKATSNDYCRPFDQARAGINLGEAAATIVLGKEAPLRKGDKIRLTAGAICNDATHISAPSRTGEGLYNAIQRVLAATGAEQDSIDFISAHGTATIYNDEMEACAFFRAGLDNVPMHSLKSYFGHTLGAAGVLESAMAMESLLENTFIPMKWFENSGVTHHISPILYPATQQMQRCLKTSSGFGGNNAVVLFEKC